VEQLHDKAGQSNEQSTARSENLRQFGVLLLVVGVVGALAWLWLGTIRRSETVFLPRFSGAEWIMYPASAQGGTHQRVELSTAFRCGFVLSQPPSQASLQVAGFSHYSITLNGVELSATAEHGRNWKQRQQFEVANQLRAGQNEIVVTVSSSNGPPCLWLALDTGRERLATSEEWESSYAGASWRPTRLATRPMLTSVGSQLAGGQSISASFRKCWPTLLILAALSFAAWLSMRNKAITDRALLIGLTVIWIVLFANNLGALPALYGFDAAAHMEYVQYISEHKSLPLANEGYEMFQPPLYYVLCAALLKLCGLSLPQPGAVLALRLFGMAVGIAHWFLVWASLRLLFEEDRGVAKWGGALAACLPMLVYLSQYITNEGFAAACVSACIYVCLRMLQRDQNTRKDYALLGFCLGLAMLAKSTALLALPAVFGALIWRALRVSVGKPALRSELVKTLAGSSFSLAVCVAVCGWHYARTWKHFGSPFIGVWDPRLGYSYWQDEGYRTAAYYLRFGASLVNPWFSGLNSFADGIYSTLWGDGALGGTSTFAYQPPWNYPLMAAAYWLALVPTTAAVIGAILILKRFAGDPRPEWVLMLGLGILGVIALVQMSLVVPQRCVIKAFYILCALTPFCACAAWGLSWLWMRGGKMRPILICGFTLWAMTGLTAFWIPHHSSRAILAQAGTLRVEARFTDAAALLKPQVQQQFDNDELRSLLADTLMRVGDLHGALESAQMVLQRKPNDAQAWTVRAAIESAQGQADAAMQDYRRLTEIAPGQSYCWQQLTRLLLEQGRIDEALSTAGEGLAADPYSADLHYFLGIALNASGKAGMAASQLSLASELNPQWSAPHAVLGAILLASGRFDDATNQLNQALQIEPENAQAHCQLADALEKRGNASAAVAHYTEALRLQPQLSEAATNLVRLRRNLTKADSE
jgi:tetratricopeptide (TPR) repeat protein